MSRFKVIIFSSAEPQQVKQLLRHLLASLPEIELIILHQSPRPSWTIVGGWGRGRRMTARSGLIRSALSGIATYARLACVGVLDSVLRWVHAAPKYPNGRAPTVDGLIDYAESKGIRFCLTDDLCSQSSLKLAHGVNPNLGVVYGDGTVLQSLLRIPDLGSIQVRRHDVTDSQGDGTRAFSRGRRAPN